MRAICYGFVRVPVPGTPVSIAGLAATLIGTATGPFAITLATNDVFVISVDGGLPQTVTLTAGASRSATQVIGEINAQTTGITAIATAGNKIILVDDTLGATSKLLVGVAGNTAAATLGFTAGVTALGNSDQRCAKIHLIPISNNAGIVYVGNSASFDTTTGVGLIDYLLKPVATPAGLDRFTVESQSDVNVLNTKDYFIDAGSANDGVVVTVWPV